MASPESIPNHLIQVRRPRIKFDSNIEPYYIKDNAIISHLLTSYNLTVPAVEQLTVDWAAQFKDKVQDPQLRSSLKKLCGQEVQHTQIISLFTQHFEHQGYNIKVGMMIHNWYFGTFLRFMPASWQLVFITIFEHFGMSFARAALKNHLYDNSAPAIRQLWLWHAVEEIEHKCVPFDVLNTTYSKSYSKNYFFRALCYFYFVLEGIFSLFVWTLKLIRQDFKKNLLNFKNLRSHWKICRHDPNIRGFFKDFFIYLAKYLRPEYHPSQIDDRDVLKDYLPEVQQFS